MSILQVQSKNVRYRKNVLGLIEMVDDLSGEVLAVQKELRPGMPDAEMRQVEIDGKTYMVQKGIDLHAAPQTDTYNALLGDLIIEAIEEGETLKRVLSQPGFPRYSTILLWAEKHQKFGERLTRARKARAEMIHDEIVEISEKFRDGSLTKGQVEAFEKAANLLKWSAEKSDPQRFGTAKAEANVGGVSIIIQTGISREPLIVEVKDEQGQQRPHPEQGRDIPTFPRIEETEGDPGRTDPTITD